MSRHNVLTVTLYTQ